MDTQEDFLFLEQCIAEKYNPLTEGEYIVIQTRTGSWRLHPLHRGFSYWQADRFAELENLGSDYCHYSVRILHNGKLHKVDTNGYPTEVAKEQDWQVHQQYYDARYVENQDCDIHTCLCSYPVFWHWRDVPGAYGQTVRDWRSVTCIVEDYGREINHCPNCNQPLLSLLEEDIDPPGEDEDDWWDWEETPETCQGCQYYNTNSQVACAVHPFGTEDEYCPDYSLG